MSRGAFPERSFPLACGHVPILRQWRWIGRARASHPYRLEVAAGRPRGFLWVLSAAFHLGFLAGNVGTGAIRFLHEEDEKDATDGAEDRTPVKCPFLPQSAQRILGHWNDLPSLVSRL